MGKKIVVGEFVQDILDNRIGMIANKWDFGSNCDVWDGERNVLWFRVHFRIVFPSEAVKAQLRSTWAMRRLSK